MKIPESFISGWSAPPEPDCFEVVSRAIDSVTGRVVACGANATGGACPDKPDAQQLWRGARSTEAFAVTAGACTQCHARITMAEVCR